MSAVLKLSTIVIPLIVSPGISQKKSSKSALCDNDIETQK